MSLSASVLTAQHHDLDSAELLDEPLDVLDLPQLYQKPSASVLLSVLTDLTIAPSSWGVKSQSGSLLWSHDGNGVTSPCRRTRKIKSEGVPQYLTKIISSSLKWIEDDREREQIWESASLRLSERSGRTGMGDITRTFNVPARDVSRSTVTTENGTRIADVSDRSSSHTAECVCITLHEPALTADNLGFKTWGSSFQLAQRLNGMRGLLSEALKSRSPILELGAGTGLVGLAAAAVLGAQVLLTDLPEIEPNLKHNVRANAGVLIANGGSADTAVLDWSVEEPPNGYSERYFRLIFAADPIYSDSHPRMLVQTIGKNLARLAESRVVFAIPVREGYSAERTDLRRRMEKLGMGAIFECEDVGTDDWGQPDRPDELTEVRCWLSVWSWS